MEKKTLYLVIYKIITANVHECSSREEAEAFCNWKRIERADSTPFIREIGLPVGFGEAPQTAQPAEPTEA